MDFKKRVPFDKTGLMVSRLGVASGFGVPTAAIEKAFHEYDIIKINTELSLNLKQAFI